MQDIYQTFEFYKIKQSLLEYSHTDLGKEYISNLKMFSSYDELITAKEELEETSFLITRFGNMPIHSSKNILKLIDIAHKTALLSEKDLDAVAEDVITCNKIIKYLDNVDSSYPHILDKCKRMYDLSSLEKEIHKVISPSLSLFDNATPTLKEIRTKLKKLQGEILSRGTSITLAYSSYLNDENSTIREGHFVLAVKTAYKSKVPGIIYDVSDTGNTTFIEPLEMVELNNQITSLKLEEVEEVRKILKSLTSLVLLQENEVITNNKIIGELDFISSKVIYGINNNCIIAKNSKEQLVDLQQVRHPLIDSSRVVANSYHLDETKRIIIISGPNAGGKTVSLKTIGISILMNQCALPIFAKEGTLGFFNNIYIDIGDNQSLSDNLSTFSAHISHIAEITNKVKGRDIVLVDELGTGTDPKEGEAIALAVTKYLESKHTLAVISSHFSALKEYAFTSNNIENSSMIFNEKELKPTYIFKQGVPGKSYAIEVAARYGLKEDILSEASKYIKDNNTGDVTSLIKTLQEKVLENTLVSEDLDKRSNELRKQEKIYENNVKLLNNRKEHLLDEVNKEKEIMISSARNNIQEIIMSLSNNKNIKLHDAVAAKKRIDDMVNHPSLVDEIFDEELSLSDYVEIPSLGIEGTISKIKNNKVVVTNKGINLTIEANKCHKIVKEEYKLDSSNNSSNGYHPIIDTSGIGIELNMIGMHVDEAHNALDKYIDDCVLHHLKQVRIIHGFGSGALRKMTREYLDTKKKILSYRGGNEYEGGGGVTVVIFND